MAVGTDALRVALAENSVLFRTGLHHQLTSAGVQVIHACGSATELLAAITEDVPDLVLLDIRMPPTETDEGIAAAARIRADYPHVGLLILSTYAESAYAAAVLSIGSSAIGYLLKDRVSDLDQLLDAIRRIARGEVVVDPGIVSTLLQQRLRQQALERLTPQERLVLALMAEGRSNAGIAERMSLVVRTVEAHTTTIFSKLGVPGDPQTNRRVAAVIAWLRDS